MTHICVINSTSELNLLDFLLNARSLQDAIIYITEFNDSRGMTNQYGYYNT